MKNRWTVVQENLTGFRNYIFGDGDLSEFYTEDEMKNKDVEIVPYEKWTSNDFAEILSNEYEDANYHRFTNLPNIILQAIREEDLDTEIDNRLMKRICEALYDEI